MPALLRVHIAPHSSQAGESAGASITLILVFILSASFWNPTTIFRRSCQFFWPWVAWRSTWTYSLTLTRKLEDLRHHSPPPSSSSSPKKSCCSWRRSSRWTWTSLGSHKLRTAETLCWRRNTSVASRGRDGLQSIVATEGKRKSQNVVISSDGSPYHERNICNMLYFLFKYT